MSEITGIVKSIRKIMRNDNGVSGDAQRMEQIGWMLFLKIFSDKDKELEILNDDYISPIPNEYQWDAWAGDEEGITGDDLVDFVDNKLFPTFRNLDVSSKSPRAHILRDVFTGNYNYMKKGTYLRQIINKLNQINFNNSKDKQLFGEVYESFLNELQSAGSSGEYYTPRAVVSFMTEIINPRLGEKILDTSCGTGGFLTASIEHLKLQSKKIEDRKLIEKNVIGWEYKPLPYLLATTNLILHDVEVPNLKYDDSLSRPLVEIGKNDEVDVILANPPFGGDVVDGNEKNFPSIYQTKESADLFLILMIELLKTNGRAAIVLPDGSLTGDGVKERIRKKLLEDCNLHTIVRLPNSVFQPYASVATNLLFFTKGTPTKEVWYYEHKLPEGQKAYSKTKPIQISEFDTLKSWWEDRTKSEVAWKVDIETIKNNGYNLDIKNPHKVEEEEIHSSTELLEMLHNSFAKSDELLKKLQSELSNV